MKKKLLAVVLCVFCTLNLVACGEKVRESPPMLMDESEYQTVEEDTSEAEEAEEETEEEIDLLNVNQIENGDFSEGVAKWATFFSKGGIADFYNNEGKGCVDIMTSGTLDYSVQIYYDGFKLEMGGVYEFSFDMDSTIERPMEARLQINGGDYHAYASEKYDLTPETQHYSMEFTMEEGTDPAPRLCFNLGTPEGEEMYGNHIINIDNVCVKLIDDSNVLRVEAVDRTVPVNTNQVGFLTKARKTAVVRGADSGMQFELIDESGNSVYTGDLSSAVEAEFAAETVYQADFSDFTKAGKYTVKVEGVGESYPFEIGDNVYDDLLKSTFLMLYSQRCGMETDKAVVGEFAHPECHNTKALIYGTNNYKEVNGGWHDAGDYGRYVVSGAQSVEDLFLCYEDYPEVWQSDDIGIPESGNGIPDILDEARYELDWLMKMQDEKSGGVYHKVSCREFPQFVMPEEETDELVLAPISTCATADFAAIMAKASDMYKEIDPEFSKAALKASLKAWDYLEKNDMSKSFVNPEDILTGEYPDGQDKDERFWASCELLKVTGDTKYKDFAEAMMEKYILHGFGWDSMGTFGNIAYAALPEELQNKDYMNKLTTEVTAKADTYLDNSRTDGYMVALGDKYCWGSNLSVCADARQMLFANKLNGKNDYINAAYDQMTYILGQNSCSYCFVTGFGSLTGEHVHHRPSIVVGTPIKGMVIGGPDGALEDPYAKSVLADLPPAKCYADNEQSFSTNEVTIYWNTPFVYLLSAEIAQNK